MTKPSQIKLLMAVGSVVLAYWLIFYLYVFQDRYLDSPTVGLFIKTILPVAVIIGIVGLILGCMAVSNQRQWGNIVVALYGVPLLAGAGFFWWLFFGVKI